LGTSSIAGGALGAIPSLTNLSDDQLRDPAIIRRIVAQRAGLHAPAPSVGGALDLSQYAFPGSTRAVLLQAAAPPAASPPAVPAPDSLSAFRDSKTVFCPAKDDQIERLAEVMLSAKDSAGLNLHPYQAILLDKGQIQMLALCVQAAVAARGAGMGDEGPPSAAAAASALEIRKLRKEKAQLKRALEESADKLTATKHKNERLEAEKSSLADALSKEVDGTLSSDAVREAAKMSAKAMHSTLISEVSALKRERDSLRKKLRNAEGGPRRSSAASETATAATSKAAARANGTGSDNHRHERALKAYVRASVHALNTMQQQFEEHYQQQQKDDDVSEEAKEEKNGDH